MFQLIYEYLDWKSSFHCADQFSVHLFENKKSVQKFNSNICDESLEFQWDN